MAKRKNKKGGGAKLLGCSLPSEPHLVAVIQRNDAERIEVRVGRVGCTVKQVVDIRVGALLAGGWQATRVGLTIEADLLPALVEALVRAEQEIASDSH